MEATSKKGNHTGKRQNYTGSFLSSRFADKQCKYTQRNTYSRITRILDLF